MTTIFNMTRDINGYNGFGLIPADDIQDTTLLQNIAQTFTVPSNFSKWIAIFAPQLGANIYVARNATATIPGDTVTSTKSEYLPEGWQLNAGDTISAITPDVSATLTIKYYALSL